MKHLIGAGGYCLNCGRVVTDWNTPCVPREVHTPFRGNEPEPFAAGVPKE